MECYITNFDRVLYNTKNVNEENKRELADIITNDGLIELIDFGVEQGCFPEEARQTLLDGIQRWEDCTGNYWETDEEKFDLLTEQMGMDNTYLRNYQKWQDMCLTKNIEMEDFSDAQLEILSEFYDTSLITRDQFDILADNRLHPDTIEAIGDAFLTRRMTIDELKGLYTQAFPDKTFDDFYDVCQHLDNACIIEKLCDDFDEHYLSFGEGIIM